jgi:hypothetical protein
MTTLKVLHNVCRLDDQPLSAQDGDRPVDELHNTGRMWMALAFFADRYRAVEKRRLRTRIGSLPAGSYPLSVRRCVSLGA